MTARWIKSIGCAVVALVGAVATAGAQSYDGQGVIKFGVFGQVSSLNYDQSLPAIASASSTGFAGGVSAGYDYTFGRHLLLGVEIDGSLGDNRANTNVAPFTNYGFDYMMTLRGRLGVYAHPGWLIYGTGGAAWLGFEAQNNGVAISKASETVNGWVAGVGTEIDWHHVIFFAEYLHAGFDAREFTLNSTVRHSVEADADLFRVGLKFKVGHDHDTGRFYEPMK